MQSFHAMGTDVAVLTSLPAEAEREATAAVRGLFRSFERRFSRFGADSELSQLNRAVGPFRVSPALLDELLRAKRWLLRTGGLFDPGVGTALLALGYRSSFAGGAAAASRPRPTQATGAPQSFRDVVIHVDARTVERPAGLHIDLGGLLKGVAVDRAAALIHAPGAINAGGDVAPCGGAAGDGLIVDVEDPFDAAAVLLTLRVRAGAVATSGRSRRRWRVNDREVHHLIDPRTGLPSTSDLMQVTAIAATAEAADVLAKCALLQGSDEGARFLLREGAAGVLVNMDGSVRRVGALEVIDG